MKKLLIEICKLLIISILIVALFHVDYANSGVRGIIKGSKAVGKVLKGEKIVSSEIKMYSKLKNLPDITKAITKYNPETRKAIMLAIAAERGIINPAEIEELYINLGKVDGFENVVKLLCAPDPGNIKGALFELKLANSATKKGYNIIKLRGPFYGDPNKKWTDIDIVVEKVRGRKFAFECKAYSGQVMADMVAKDSDTLLYFQKENPGTILVFSFVNQPSALTIKLLQRKGITPLWGDPDSQIKALDVIL